MKKLTKKEEKRIVILKDALKHIKANRIIPEKGQVITYEDNVITSECDLEDKNIQKFLKTMNRKKKPCKVCARGSILFSSIWKNNKFYKDLKKGNEANSHKVIIGKGVASQKTKENEYLEKFFDKKQLALMESAFENNYNRSILTAEELQDCSNFYEEYNNSHDRLEAIIKNAIKNNGTFIP